MQLSVTSGVCSYHFVSGVGVQSIVLSMAGVCLTARISQKQYGRTSQNLLYILMPVTGPVLLWRCCDTLCTSGFVYSVMFSHSGLRGASCIFSSGKSVTAETTSSISTKFCSKITISKYTHRGLWMWTGGEVCYTRLTCFTSEMKANSCSVVLLSDRCAPMTV